MEKPCVVVLGAGFAGLHAVRRLAREPVRVVWVDERNYHCFLPLVYQVATAGLEPQDIAYPTRSILRRLPEGEFRLARVESGDPDAGVLHTAGSEDIRFDYLIVAAGGVAEQYDTPGAASAQKLYDLEDARALRNHLLRALERADTVTDAAERAALLTVVIVGGGPTGVELAGALGEFRRHVLPRDYRRLAAAPGMRIVIVEAGPDVLPPFPPKLRARARRDLDAFGVEVHTSTRVARIGADHVELANGAHVPSATVVWAAGIRANPVAAALGLATGRAGRVRVDATLQTVGHARVFAAGDIAIIDTADRLPQVAQVAIQEGRHAAENVLRSIRGEPLLPFAYHDKGAMATIGRSRAVALIGRLQLDGFIAWLAWLAVHLVMLIGFRNRLVVLVNWAWNYVTYDRGLRAIIGAEPEREVEPPRAAARVP